MLLYWFLSESVPTYFFKLRLIWPNFSPLYLLNDMISELKVAFHITLTGHLNHLLDCFVTLSVHRRAVQQQCVCIYHRSWCECQVTYCPGIQTNSASLAL